MANYIIVQIVLNEAKRRTSIRRHANNSPRTGTDECFLHKAESMMSEFRIYGIRRKRKASGDYERKVLYEMRETLQ